MNAEALLKHYERIADAPDAVGRLRRFIIDLAVRGKLVPQNASNMSASEIVNEIAAEKIQLVESGKLRKQRKLSPISQNEIPVDYAIRGWVWVRLGEIATLITKGSTPTSYGHPYTAEGVNFIKVEAIRNGALEQSNITSHISDATNEFLSRSQLMAGDILFSIAGSIGTCAVVPEEVLPANTNQALAIIRGTQRVFLPIFLLKTLQSFVADPVLKKARGGAMNNVSLDDIQNMVVPLPPVSEQHRIVAKVDELMALCNQLEAARAAREATRDRLAAASLARLNTPDPGPETFKAHASFAISTALPALTTRPDQIKQLRQTILNLAVRGMLAPQEYDERENAQTRASLDAWRSLAIQKKEIREPRKQLGLIVETDHPYPKPAGWTFARLGDVIYIQSGDGLTSSQMRNGDVPVFGGNGVNGYHDQNNVDAETIVIGRVGYYCGSIHVTPARAWVTDNAFITRYPADLIDQRYLVLLLKGTNLKENENATAQPVISGSKIYPIVVGIPPLPEQKIIVATFDKFMSLCDQLEASMSRGEKIRSRLLNALLHEALAPANRIEEAA